MNIYKISEKTKDKWRNSYDSNGSAIVVAPSTEEAVKVHPSGYLMWEDNQWFYDIKTPETKEFGLSKGIWASPDLIKAELIGKADKKFIKTELIVSSFTL